MQLLGGPPTGSLSSKALGALSQLAPDGLAVKQHAAMSEPGSAGD